MIRSHKFLGYKYFCRNGKEVPYNGRAGVGAYRTGAVERKDGRSVGDADKEADRPETRNSRISGGDSGVQRIYDERQPFRQIQAARRTGRVSATLGKDAEWKFD